jgi:glutathione S-transferase
MTVTTREHLVLYDSLWCGYCRDVREVIEELGLPVMLRRVSGDPAVRQELFQATGRYTVPVLRIERADGGVRFMPESRDIIRYLRGLARQS